jgi:hypothetical protein
MPSCSIPNGSVPQAVGFDGETNGSKLKFIPFATKTSGGLAPRVQEKHGRGEHIRASLRIRV